MKGSEIMVAMRFIPTYVGHTTLICDVTLQNSVHPHIRGAYRVVIDFQVVPNGSSPHTWGIHTGREANPGTDRFIPTYVGHTSWTPWRT